MSVISAAQSDSDVLKEVFSTEFLQRGHVVRLRLTAVSPKAWSYRVS